MKQEKTKPLAKLAPQPAEPVAAESSPKDNAPAADKPSAPEDAAPVAAPALDPENASVRAALAMPPKVEEPRGKVCRYRIAEGQGDLLRNGKHYRPGDELDLPSDVAERLGKLVEAVQ